MTRSRKCGSAPSHTRACGYAATRLSQPFLVRETDPARVGAGRDDDRASLYLLARTRPQAERSFGEVHPGYVLRDDPRAETLGLVLEVHHHLLARDALRESGVVLDLGREHELPAGDHCPAERALIHERLEIRASARRSRPSHAAGPEPMMTSVSFRISDILKSPIHQHVHAVRILQHNWVPALSLNRRATLLDRSHPRDRDALRSGRRTRSCPMPIGTTTPQKTPLFRQCLQTTPDSLAVPRVEYLDPVKARLHPASELRLRVVPAGVREKGHAPRSAHHFADLLHGRRLLLHESRLPARDVPIKGLVVLPNPATVGTRGLSPRARALEPLHRLRPSRRQTSVLYPAPAAG